MLMVFFALRVSAQKIIKTKKVSDKSIHVFGNNFEGVIFTEKYSLRFAIAESNGKNFTPTENDILIAEKLVRTGLDTIKNADNHNFVVRSRLKHYWRQYFGYINDKGERIIIINALWKDPDFIPYNEWLNEIVLVNDGGDNYWDIKININKLKLFEFGVHGVA